MNENSSSAEGACASGLRALKKKPAFKWVILPVIIIVLAAGVYILAKEPISQAVTGSQRVRFTVLDAGSIPKSIEAEVIPEYRDMERALACMLDGKVYVVVTRGEKPTAGYGLTINDMRLEKDDGRENLAVKVTFTEPDVNDSSAAVITYPYQVAVTELEKLPKAIELVVKYAE